MAYKGRLSHASGSESVLGLETLYPHFVCPTLVGMNRLIPSIYRWNQRLSHASGNESMKFTAHTLQETPVPREWE